MDVVNCYSYEVVTSVLSHVDLPNNYIERFFAKTNKYILM